MSSKYNRYVSKFWNALSEDSLQYFASEVDKAILDAKHKHSNRWVELRVLNSTREWGKKNRFAQNWH